MKRKITIDRPTIDSKEIASKQDFSNVLNNIPAAPTVPFYKTIWFYTTLACVAGIAFVAINQFSDPTKKEVLLATENAPTPDTINQTASNEFNYAEDTPCVKPLKKDMDIPMTIYQVDGIKGGELIHPTGTKITIPKAAFVDEQNQPIAGIVDIHFREINHPVDIMLSGIPMQYDSANQEMVLLSDGMIEIEGYLNGKKVKIAPNKTIDIALKATTDETKFNSYHLDTTSKNWKYTGKPDYEKTDKLIVNHTVKHPDQSFAEEIKQLQKESNIAKHQYETAQKAVTDWTKSAPVKPVSGGNKDRQFVLDVNAKEFPELSNYQNLVFEVEKNDPNFSASVYQQEWSDVSLSEKEKGKKYYLTLFKSGSKKTFSVFPVFSGDDLKKAQAAFNKSFSTYSNELEKRQKVEADYKAQFEGKLAQWEKAKEKEAVALELKQNEVENTNKVKFIARVLNVTTFGIWNIDCGVSPPTGIAQKVIFKDQHGNEVDILYANLFEKGKKTIYTYNKNDFKNFEYNPEEENVIVAFLGTDKVGIVLNDQFEENKKLKTTTFVLDIQPLTEELIASLKSKTM
jgi:hypothetical protein